MIKVNDIYKAVDDAAPFSAAADFDNAGLLVGSSEKEVTKALICLDVTESVIAEAKALGAELIISHHPVIFHPLKRVMEEDVVYKLIENRLTVLSCHTNLDKAEKIGVNYTLAEKIGMKEISEKAEFLLEGKVEPTTLSQFAERVKAALDLDFIEAVIPEGKDPDETIIETAAVSCGAGGDSVFMTSCDAFITGEMKHHELLYAKEKGIAAFVAGHYHSEIIYREVFMYFLREKFPEVEFMVSESENPPSRYL